MNRLEAIDAALLASMPMPALPAESDKEARGRVLVVGGGGRAPGGALLAALAALRVGAGKLQIAAGRSYALGLALAMPESLVIPVEDDTAGEISPEAADAICAAAERADAVVIGPGMLTHRCAPLAKALAGAVKPDAVLLLDAAALEGLLEAPEALAPVAGRLILTPHAGEMAGLIDWDKAEVQADPVGAARRVANVLGAVVVMKGVATHVVSPDGRAWLYEGGSRGLGVSGSGDVLAGAIAGLAARGAAPLAAAARGVFAHGEAGRILSQDVGALGFLAREVADRLPQAMRLAGGLPDGG